MHDRWFESHSSTFCFFMFFSLSLHFTLDMAHSVTVTARVGFLLFFRVLGGIVEHLNVSRVYSDR